jgi:hypothetical protein
LSPMRAVAVHDSQVRQASRQAGKHAFRKTRQDLSSCPPPRPVGAPREPPIKECWSQFAGPTRAQKAKRATNVGRPDTSGQDVTDGLTTVDTASLWPDAHRATNVGRPGL